MSLDLAGKSGVAYSTTAITDATGFVDTIFDASEIADAGKYVVKVDTTALVDLSTLPAPSTLPFLADGDEITFIKVTTDTNSIVVDDQTPGANFNGVSGTKYTYVNRQGEGITLYVDASNDKWGVQI